MAQKINLAVLNKKKEELDQKEMHEARGGGTACGSCSSIDDNNEAVFLIIEGASCGCGSIWVIFGLSL